MAIMPISPVGTQAVLAAGVAASPSSQRVQENVRERERKRARFQEAQRQEEQRLVTHPVEGTVPMREVDESYTREARVAGHIAAEAAITEENVPVEEARRRLGDGEASGLLLDLQR